jgi:hypothetical protein
MFNSFQISRVEPNPTRSLFLLLLATEITARRGVDILVHDGQPVTRLRCPISDLSIEIREGYE